MPRPFNPNRNGRPAGALSKSTIMSELRRSLKEKGVDLPDIICSILEDENCTVRDKIRLIEICIEHLYPKLKPMIVDDEENTAQKTTVPLAVTLTDLIKIAKEDVA